jgi:hypothetical protein
MTKTIIISTADVFVANALANALDGFVKEVSHQFELNGQEYVVVGDYSDSNDVNLSRAFATGYVKALTSPPQVTV